MRRTPSHSLLGPALLLYLVADAARAQGQLDLLGALIAALAGLLSLTPLWMAREELPGSQRVGWLGLAAACALVRSAAPRALSLTVELSEALALAAAGALLLDLALCVPDRFFAPRRSRALRALVYLGCACAALLGLGALAPELRALGQPWLAPAWLARVPAGSLVVCTSLALFLRLRRRRLSSSEEALASNAWALLGLAPAALLAWTLCVVFVARLELGAEAVRIALAAAAALLVFCHLRLRDPSRRLSVGPATRNAVAAVLTLALAAAASLLLAPAWPEGPLGLALAALALTLFAAVGYKGLRELARLALAPASGRLLLALERGHAELADVSNLDGVAKVVLGAARAASGSVLSEPALYLFDPALELRIDAAGQPHAAERPLHQMLVSALRERPGELLLRAPLEAQFVRQPRLRPLIEALCGLDALCLLPLIQAGEFEGALLVPRGTRKSRLTLEEIAALQRFGRHCAGFLSVLCTEARASRRAGEVLALHKRTARELEHANEELARLAAEVRVLRGGDAFEGPYSASVAYSPAMRALKKRVEELASSSAPLLLWAEGGLSPLPLARLLHHGGGRGPQPFVVAECGALRPDQSLRALASDDPHAPGFLRMAADGSLLLRDLPALALPAQRALCEAMGARGPRIIAACRRDPDQLAAEGALLPELRARFPHVLRIPPLRERREDLASLLLLALDHAARVLGRPACGLEPEAQARLLAHDWPGNLEELMLLVERAVARAQGPRVSVRDLGLAEGSQKEGHPLDGTLERVERRVLRRALDRTDGNKSEAARLLGLPRTTFLDKLRRYGLEEGNRARSAGEAESN